MKKSNVGGQAVIEGVMMKGQKGLAIAIRKPNGKIQLKIERKSSQNKKKILSIPILRGMFILIDSLITGVDIINYSANFFDDLEPSKFEDWLREKFGEKSNDIIMAFTVGLSFLMAAIIFLIIPTSIAEFFKRYGVSALGLNFIEAAIRITILVGYMYGISKLEDIYRVFQYHGAEHKVIACYEAEEELTVENVRPKSRYHARCGTNFLFLVMMVSILIFALTGWGSIIERLVLRIIFVPVIAGITYEIIKWLGKTESKLGMIIAYPGIQLQRLTTKEPDDQQIQVAIEALMAAEDIQFTIGELLNIGNEKLKTKEIDTYILDSQLLLGKVLDKDKLYLITNRSEKVDNELKLKYLDLLEKRSNNMPMAYIIGNVEFMGLDFKVKAGVLIPRGDTEILVEEVLKEIKEDEALNICDLCCGSGAIGISLAHFRNNINVDLIDYYKDPKNISIKNIKEHNLQDRVKFIKSDLLQEVKNKEIKYSIIVSNPPYIKEEVINTLMKDVKEYEPKTALSGGADGLEFYVKIIQESKDVLVDKGILAFEIGHDQGIEVSDLMRSNGFSNVRVIKDLASLDRVVIGYLNIDI